VTPRTPAAAAKPKPAQTAAVTETDLGSAHVFMTGGTGFVGQAILERLLADHPGTTVSLLVRTKGSASGDDRLRSLLRKPVFRSWRERVGDEGVKAAVTGRLRVVEGSLGALGTVPDDIDVVIHSASTVSFDPPIDQAFASNVAGAMDIYGSLTDSGSDPHVVHVSTAYVGGIRKGVVPEARLEHEVDWRAEHAVARSAKERVEISSRQPEALRGFIGIARSQHSKEGPQAVAKAAEAARVQWVHDRLVDFGRIRAESLGWTDVYTLTKAFSERAAEELWGQAGHRLSIVRPSIIESALRHPFPGWIDGFKVADPLILAYGRGILPEFPGLPDSILDVIPVDFVVNAILAAAANPAPVGEPAYYQVTSGTSNPLPFHDMVRNVNEFFSENPVPQAGEGHIQVPTWKLPGGREVERRTRLAERANDARERIVERLPSSERTRGWLAGIQQRRNDLESFRTFANLYRAYVQSEIIFDDTNTRRLNDALPGDLKVDRGFDVRDIDWDDYLQRVHVPAITTLTRAFAVRPAAKQRAAKALPQRSDVVAIFDFEGTVVDSNIVEQYLWVRSAGFRKATWPKEAASLLTSLPRYLKAEHRDRGEFIRAFLRRYSGVPVEQLEKIVERGYTETLLRHTMPSAVERIKEHRAAGHRTVLVTGSIGTLVAPLAALFDEVVASTMHARDGVLTGYLDKPPLVDEARAAWLRQYAAAHGLDLSESYGYGDSHADLVWLEMLGNPHAVNPDTHLSREALRRRWSINNWKRGSHGVSRDFIEGSGGSSAGITREGAEE
jgi:HAD superfamily hydrolase (TIGR01490 family)